MSDIEMDSNDGYDDYYNGESFFNYTVKVGTWN